jgi:nucleotide-binding universal stress UspA family protein
MSRNQAQRGTNVPPSPKALIEASKSASLLVVGSRGHGAFSGMLLGSVSIHCVTSASCPVTVVRNS